MKQAVRLGAAVGALVIVVAGWNYVSAARPVTQRLAQDSRNDKLSLWAYHQYGLVPGTLVVDLRQLSGEVATIDVMRALLQSAEAQKDAKFDRVLLSYRGNSKFYLDGEYYQELGKEFGAQNPMYTLRTFPEHVRKLDGTPAYGTWTGGMFGVLGKQMEDLAEFSKAWYLDDALEERATVN